MTNEPPGASGSFGSRMLSRTMPRLLLPTTTSSQMLPTPAQPRHGSAGGDSEGLDLAGCPGGSTDPPGTSNVEVSDVGRVNSVLRGFVPIARLSVLSVTCVAAPGSARIM